VDKLYWVQLWTNCTGPNCGQTVLGPIVDKLYRVHLWTNCIGSNCGQIVLGPIVDKLYWAQLWTNCTGPNCGQTVLGPIVDKLYWVQLHQQINHMEKNDKVFVAQLIQEFPAFYGLTCGERLVKNFGKPTRKSKFVSQSTALWFSNRLQVVAPSPSSTYAAPRQIVLSAHPLNPLKPELNPICYLLAVLGAHHFLHVSRIRVKSLSFRRLMSYIYIWSTHSWCF